LPRTCKLTHYAALAAVALCAAPARPQNLDALYKEVKAEGRVVLYAGGPTAPWDAAAKNFSARYPGVIVSVSQSSADLVVQVAVQIKH
jgi:hypothetical protein